MNCNDFKSHYSELSKLPLPKEVWESDLWHEWSEHRIECKECSDWDLEQRVKARGFDTSDFPCVHIANQQTFSCEEHKDLNECPDTLIKFDKQTMSYKINSMGATYEINNCPWCGANLY